MEVVLGRPGSTIRSFLTKARSRIIVISPWIGREEAKLLMDLCKRVKMLVVTQPTSNPSLEVMSRHVVNPVYLTLLVISALGGVLLAIGGLWTLSIIPFILALFFFTKLRKKVLVDCVKIVENLHAKVYIADDRVILTSANFTPSGQFRNVEIMVILDESEASGVIERVEEWIKRLQY